MTMGTVLGVTKSVTKSVTKGTVLYVTLTFVSVTYRTVPFVTCHVCHAHSVVLFSQGVSVFVYKELYTVFHHIR